MRERFRFIGVSDFLRGFAVQGRATARRCTGFSNAILFSVFPILRHASPARMFSFFAFVMTVQIGVVWPWCPKTRGTSSGSFAAAEDRTVTGLRVLP